MMQERSMSMGDERTFGEMRAVMLAIALSLGSAIALGMARFV